MLVAWVVVLQGLVFVHANGRVALQRSEGDQTYTLFDKGREPCLAPDGKRVVYWTSAPGGIDASAPLVWADVDGGKRGQLRAGNLRSPHFSPDGKQLLWGEMVDGRWAVMRGAADGSGAKLAFRGPDSVFHADWLPDGRGIITHDLRTVYWVDLAGQVTRQLAVEEIVGAEASISSDDRFLVSPVDDKRLLYSAEVEPSKAMTRAVSEGGQSALFVYDLPTRTRRRLTGEDVFAHDPAWARDGKSVFARGFGVGKKKLRDGILRVPVDGGAPLRVAPGSEPSP